MSDDTAQQLSPELRSAGRDVSDYTGAAFNAPQRTWKTRVASVARLLAYSVHRELGVRLLGGETLLVLAR